MAIDQIGKFSFKNRSEYYQVLSKPLHDDNDPIVFFKRELP